MSTTNSTPDPVYIVFGATGGIGSQLCRRLHGRGARVIPAARDPQRLQSLSEEMGAPAVPLDATRFDDVESCVSMTVERFGRLDGVANCIGSLLLKPAHLTSEAEWTVTLTTNLTSAFAVVRAATKALTSGGSIVLVSSAAARLGLANHEAIAAAKAGIIGLTLSAAASYGPRGIRVNCVAPGLVRTSLTARLTQNELTLKASTAMHVLGRIGEPGDVAAAID